MKFQNEGIKFLLDFYEKAKKKQNPRCKHTKF